MDKKKLYTLFMALLMAGSIFSFSFFLGGTNNSNQPPAGTPHAAINPPTAISFQATGVLAKVETIFPTVFLTASTKEADISKLNAKLAGVEGIKRVSNSFYRQQSGTSIAGALVFVAELSIDGKTDRQALAGRLGAIEGFLDSSVFSTGLVSLPKTVSFKNADLNLSQEYTFSNPASQAYLDIGTIEGDEVSVTLEASLSGSSLQNILAAEETNLTASPKIVSAGGDFEISSLENSLALNAKVPVSIAQRIGELEGKLNETSPVRDAGLNAAPSNDPLQIVFDETAVLFQQDLETFFSDYNGVVGFDANAEQRTANVFFANFAKALDVALDVAEFEQNLKRDLDALNFTVKEIIEPDTAVQGTIGFDSQNATDIIALVSPQLESFGLSEISFLEKAKVKAQELSDPKSGDAFEVDGGEFTAMVIPGHKVGQKVFLDILLIISRGKISAINASETERTELTVQ